MPVYTYRCESCGVHFDRQQKFSDQPLWRCPECGKKSLHKVYAPVGILFKGSGFYATDHRSPSGQTRNGIKRNEAKDESKGDRKETSKESNPVKNSESSE